MAPHNHLTGIENTIYVLNRNKIAQTKLDPTQLKKVPK